MHELKAASLTEAIVASTVFMTVFALSLELLPRLTVSGSDELAAVEMYHMVESARRKYANGLWPAGEYTESYDCGQARIAIKPYRDFEDVAILIIAAESGTERTVHTELVRCE